MNPALAERIISDRFIEIVGPKISFAKPFLGVPGTNFFALRSLIDRRTGSSAYQLYVSQSYFGTPRLWQGAHTAAGVPLQFIAIGRHRIGCEPACAYMEEFAADLPLTFLRHNPNGLAVIFTARSGIEQRIWVPGSQIRRQLAAVSAMRQRHGGLKPRRS